MLLGWEIESIRVGVMDSTEFSTSLASVGVGEGLGLGVAIEDKSVATKAARVPIATVWIRMNLVSAVGEGAMAVALVHQYLETV